MAVSSPQPKTQYSEIEAARELGISVEQLRSLIQNHIVENELDSGSLAVSNLYPSDLVLLKILSAGSPTNPSVHEAVHQDTIGGSH